MSTVRNVMSRRGFLTRAGTGLIVLSAGVTTGCNVLFAPDARAVAAELAGLLHHRELAFELGRTYIGTRGLFDAQSQESLTRTLLDSLGIDLDQVTLLPVANLLNALVARVRQDFASDRTVAVDGWLLSEAEARVCAILYLGEGPGGGA